MGVGEALVPAQAGARLDRIGKREAAALGPARPRTRPAVIATAVVVFVGGRPGSHRVGPQEHEEEHGGEDEPEDVKARQEHDQLRIRRHDPSVPSPAPRVSPPMRPLPFTTAHGEL
jgi:hypothetical protein